MIKKAILLVLTAILVLSLTPAQSKTLKRKNVTFSADACHVTCPYWLDPSSVPDPAKIDPTADDPVPWLLQAEGLLITDDQMWCEDNGIASWDQIKVRAPKKAELLIFQAWPEVDWDIAVCRVARGGKLKFLAFSANSIDPTDPVGYVNNIATDPNTLCAVASISCEEKVTVSVRGGKKYVLRAYNWADPSDLRARYTFLS